MVKVEYPGLSALNVEVHQLLCGREIASDVKGNPVHRMAYQMANYVYIVVNTSTKEAVIIDGGGWDVKGILQFCQQEGWIPASAVFTHRHFDHTGGRLPQSMTGGRDVTLPGIPEYLSQGCKVYVGKDDLLAIAKQSQVPREQLYGVGEGDRVALGDLSLEVLATPGHTPGSVCFRVSTEGEGGVLFTGDTLFIGSCGRVDLPESDIQAMLQSLTRLSQLPPKTLVLPGHNYAMPAHSTISQEVEMNAMMQQAIKRTATSGKGITRENCVASVRLPDYIGVALSVFENFKLKHPAHPTAPSTDSCGCESSEHKL